MIIESLLKNAAATPNDTAIVDDTGQYTFAQVAAVAAGVAQKLRELTNKQTVAILLPAGMGFVAAFYGTLMAGKSVVPVNFLLGAKEINHVLDDSDVEIVISAQALVERLLTSLPGAETIAAKAMSGKLKLLDISTVTPADPRAVQPASHEAGDMAVLMYTSGTSGLPKGVRLSYFNLQSDVDAAIEHAKLEHKHVFLGVVPLFHAFGMLAMMIAPMQLQTKVVYLQRFSAVAALNAIREHKVSLLFGVPSMFAAIGRLKDATKEDFAPMYAILSGGEPLPSTVRELFRDRFNTGLYEGYGLTETSPIIALNTPQRCKAGSVGLPLPCATVRILSEDGKAMGVTQEGEIQVKGPMVFGGYHNLPDATKAAMTEDGFFRTGDLGHLDADGYLFITGRLKDLIISAGEKVHPREIEEVLIKHPAIADAAVVAKKDDSRGEVPAAFIVAREGQTVDANAIRSFCRDAGLVGWKVPKEIIVVKDFPRNPTGKVMKRELQKQLS